METNTTTISVCPQHIHQQIARTFVAPVKPYVPDNGIQLLLWWPMQSKEPASRQALVPWLQTTYSFNMRNIGRVTKFHCLHELVSWLRWRSQDASPTVDTTTMCKPTETTTTHKKEISTTSRPKANSSGHPIGATTSRQQETISQSQ